MPLNSKQRLIRVQLKSVPSEFLEHCHAVLNNWNEYYRKLSPANQERFQWRTFQFINQIKFETYPNCELTNDVRVIIASAFTQITFGLKQYKLSLFEKIFVTPKPYAYKHVGILYNGDVNISTKTINLTWPVVKNGFKIEDDAVNLAIHEFGHTLVIENDKRLFWKFYKSKSWKEWLIHAEHKIEKIKREENKILRSYASTNVMEMFSVTLEAFFEKSEELHHHAEELYLSMVKLLKQDPRKEQDPFVKE